MLTARGWAVLVLATVAFFLSDLYSSRFLYLVSVALVALFLLSYLQLRASETGIRVTRVVSPNPCFESSRTEVEIHVQSRGFSAQFQDIRDALPASIEETGRKTRLGVGGHSLQCTYLLNAPMRGEYRIGPSLIALGDVYGLFSTKVRVGAATSLLVYPRYSKVDPRIQMRSMEVLGPTSTHRRGTSSDFLSIRRYVHGDPVKNIHWRSSAKVGQLMVRELEAEEKGSVAVLLDCSRGNQMEFETGVRAAASVAVSCLSMGMDVSVLLGGDEGVIVERGGGRLQYHAVLSSLAKAQRSAAASDGMLLDRAARASDGRGSIYYLTPELGVDEIRRAASLQSKGVAVSFVLTRQGKLPTYITSLEIFGPAGLAVARMTDDGVRLNWIR